VVYDSIVSADTVNPLEELKRLDRAIELTNEFTALKPIFVRVDELGREHAADFEVQIAVSEVKQRLIERGKVLKQTQDLTPPAMPPKSSRPPHVPSAFQPPPAHTAIVPPSTPEWPGAPPPVAGQSLPQNPTGYPQPQPGALPSRPLADDLTLSPAGSPAGAPPGDTPPPAKAMVAGQGKRNRMAMVVFAALVLIVVAGLVTNQIRKRRLAAGVPIQVTTNPPGASIRVNGEPMCTSDCRFAMPPGKYEITAYMDGYGAAASNVVAMFGKPASVTMVMEPQPQSLRVLTDLAQGKVAMDDQPAADLVDGQYVFEKVPAGTHTVKVTSRTGEATFTVEVADAKLPVVQGPVTARNLVAVLVASLGSRAHVVANGGPWKLSLNGQPQTDLTTNGVDLNGFQTGVDEILVGEGKEQRNMKESFGTAPMLTAFLKSDLNIGTLIVSTGEDDVQVFVNNKEIPRKTQKGQLRVQTIGPVSVRVAKNGFEPVAPQMTEVKKGSEVRLEFKLQPVPQAAALQIRGATPGATVLLDNMAVGTVGDDGGFADSGIKPGDHTVEFRRDRFLPKKLQRTFRAGQTLALNGADVILAAATGSLQVTRTPAEAAVVYRRGDEQQTHDLKENKLDLPPGVYVFTARAPGYTDRTERVQVVAGETHPVELALAKVVAPPPPPPPKTFGMADFETPGAWTLQDGLWTHKGAGFIPYKHMPSGTYTFTVQLLRGGNFLRGGRIRWALQYMDAKNYDLFELDKKYLYSKVIVDGKPLEREKREHGLSEKEKSYTVQIDVMPEHLIHRIRNGDNWMVVDTWADGGRDFTAGKFGFIVQGNDEIGVSDFKFTPK
jgi:hypothetical protein